MPTTSSVFSTTFISALNGTPDVCVVNSFLPQMAKKTPQGQREKEKEGSDRRNLAFSPWKSGGQTKRGHPEASESAGSSPTPTSSVSQTGTRCLGTETTVLSHRKTNETQGSDFQSTGGTKEITFLPVYRKQRTLAKPT